MTSGSPQKNTNTIKQEDNAKLLNKAADKLESYVEKINKNEKVLQLLADKVSLLVSTDNDLLKQFDTNLAAFKHFDPKIYNFFKNYSPSRHVIDIKDGFPNIFDQFEKKYLYQYPAYLTAKAQVEQYQKRPVDSLINFAPDHKNQGGFLHARSVTELLDLLNESSKPSVNKNLSKDISSLMVFGVGLGFHIEQLCNEHNIFNLYIIEPNLDLFYCSLYTASWDIILKRLNKSDAHLHFILGAEPDKTFDEIMVQGRAHGMYDFSKMYWYRHYNDKETQTLISSMKRRYHQINFSWGFFDDGVMSIGHMVKSIENKVPILKKRALNIGELSDRPVFIVGNGSSLDTLVNTIKEYQNKVIIISCGSALSALYRYGITPDIHCEQERTFPVRKKLDHYAPAKFTKSIPFVGPSTLHPEVFDFFDTKLMAIKGSEPSTALFVNSIGKDRSLFEIHYYINPTVANTALSFAYGMGFKNIYFLGVDLARKDKGSHHSVNSFYYNKEGKDLNIYNQKGKIKVKANFSDEVMSTDYFFDTSKNGIEQFLRQVDLNCFNMSDGAFIEGAEPLKPENLNIELKPISNKTEKVLKLIDSVSHQPPKFLKALKTKLDLNGYELLCNKLIENLDNKPNSRKESISLLRKQIDLLHALEDSSQVVNYSVIRGSITYIQSVLLRIVYECDSENELQVTFIKGLKIYKDFLEESIKYFKENAFSPHYSESAFVNSLKNLDT